MNVRILAFCPECGTESIRDNILFTANGRGRFTCWKCGHGENLPKMDLLATGLFLARRDSVLTNAGIDPRMIIMECGRGSHDARLAIANDILKDMEGME